MAWTPLSIEKGGFIVRTKVRGTFVHMIKVTFVLWTKAHLPFVHTIVSSLSDNPIVILNWFLLCYSKWWNVSTIQIWGQSEFGKTSICSAKVNYQPNEFSVILSLNWANFLICCFCRHCVTYLQVWSQSESGKVFV